MPLLDGVINVDRILHDEGLEDTFGIGSCGLNDGHALCVKKHR